MIAALALIALAAAPWRPDAPKTQETDLPRFQIHSTDKAAGTANLLAAELERDRDAIAERIGADYPGTTEVRIGEGIDEVLRLQPPHENAPRWAAGLAEPEENLVLLDAAALRRPGGVGVVQHEIAHLAIAQLGSPTLPRWFQEGMAMRAAAESSPEEALSLVRAADDKQRIPIDALANGFPDGYGDVELAYAESLDFVSYIANQPEGPLHLRELLAATHNGEAFDSAFQRAFGSRSELEAAWLHSLKLRYTWVPLVTGSTTSMALIALLCIAAWSRVRRRQRARMSELALEEQAVLAAERIRAAEAQVPQQGPIEAPAATKPTLH